MALDADIVIITMIFLLGYQSEVGAGIFAIGQGLLIDIFSGGTWGFHTMVYLIIFLFVKIASRPFDLFSVFGQVSVIFITVLVKGFLIILLLRLFSLSGNYSFHDFLCIACSAIFSGLAAPFVFYLLKLLGRIFIGQVKTFYESASLQ
jgi:rod shape-determining protein MreD